MSRYQALRSIGCGVFAAWLVATINRLAGVPSGVIRFMHMTIEYGEQP